MRSTSWSKSLLPSCVLIYCIQIFPPSTHTTSHLIPHLNLFYVVFDSTRYAILKRIGGYCNYRYSVGYVSFDCSSYAEKINTILSQCTANFHLDHRFSSSPSPSPSIAALLLLALSPLSFFSLLLIQVNRAQVVVTSGPGSSTASSRSPTRHSRK